MAFPGPQKALPKGTESLTVTVGTALAFTLSTYQVTPGDNVSVSVINGDGQQHTFTLSPIANYSFNPNTNSTSDLITFFAAHHPLVNIAANGSGTYTGSFIAPPFGIYEFVCLTSGHFNGGMFGFLGSGEDGSGGSAPNTGPGAPVFIIGGTIAGLVIVAIVLGFVVGRRRGKVHEMPPERLGYPEPPASPPKG